MGLDGIIERQNRKFELETCLECKGSGTVKDSGGKEKTCPKCNGYGKLRSAR